MRGWLKRSDAGSGPSTRSTGRPRAGCWARPPIACSPLPRSRARAMAAAEATGGIASPRVGPAGLDALVVGAGQAGLAAGYHLRRAGLSFEILEAGEEPGGSWPGYYESLTLFSPSRYSGLPGMPFPGSPDRYPARDEVVGYLRDYAEVFGLPVLTGERVLRAEQAGAGFRVLTAAGGGYRARNLIAATGSFARPHPHPLPAALRAADHPRPRRTLLALHLRPRSPPARAPLRRLRARGRRGRWDLC